MELRRADERGRTDLGWLDSRHTFSFGDYYDGARLGHRTLRVINDDRVAPGGGFGAHPHRDMEILSYVLSGALEHRDSLGTGSIIRAGDVQHMRAGTGVVHSEFNPSATEPVHFLQIWIVPGARGLAPVYTQRTIDPAQADGGFVLLASEDGRDGSIALQQDVRLSVTRLSNGAVRRLDVRPGRSVWLHVARGTLAVNGTPVTEGDSVLGAEGETLSLDHGIGAEVLAFDIG